MWASNECLGAEISGKHSRDSTPLMVDLFDALAKSVSLSPEDGGGVNRLSQQWVLREI